VNDRLRSSAALAGFIALTLAVGWIGSRATLPEIPGWYAELAKPSFTPPNWVFGPVWTTLYVMIAVAAWLVWRSDNAARAGALALWGVQLSLNLAWSLLFFGLKDVGLALLDIVILLVAIVVTIAAFARASRLAAWLLVPYLVWVAYATALNFAIWRLNT
jgi:tryptophan-rich sensory protein